MNLDSHAAFEKALAPFVKKMRLEGIPEAATEVFARFYRQFFEGKCATIPESDLVPLQGDEIESVDRLHRYAATGSEALKKTVIIKLNGGLGTTMGLKAPKSLIKVKDGLSFLDVTIRQTHHFDVHLGLTIPLALMNSFFTDAETGRALDHYRDLPADLRQSFLQHKFPKVLAATHEPASCPAHPTLEWNPAGHGDLLLALDTSGLLQSLLTRGYRYLFVSNIDNLGSEIDLGILGYFSSERQDFLMEVTDRTAMDRKGGHLARLKNGRLVLREAVQCDPADQASFSDIKRHPFFNTNNLWLNLESVRWAVKEKKCADFPFVTNRKKLDPLDPASPDVFHLESVLGSAISLFEKSAAVRVPRSRFLPVKNCEELLLMWSDYYVLEKDYRICANPARKSPRVQVSLDPTFYSRVDLLQSRFPFSAPSLVNCESLSIRGDVQFGRDVVIRGAVSITNTGTHQATIKDNAEISGDLVF